MKKAATIINDINGIYPTSCSERDGDICVTNETGELTFDYYELGYPWVNPELIKYIEANGLTWEWNHPGEIHIYN